MYANDFACLVEMIIKVIFSAWTSQMVCMHTHAMKTHICAMRIQFIQQHMPIKHSMQTYY